MKFAIGAVAAVALGFSMAVSAQAQTSQYQTNPSANMTQGSQAGAKQANAAHAISQKDKIKQAQQALKDEGLYNGKVDGRWGTGRARP